MSSETTPTQGILERIKLTFDLIRSANLLALDDDQKVLNVQDVTVNMLNQNTTSDVQVLHSSLCEQHCEDMIKLIALTCDTRSPLTKSIALKAEFVNDNSTTQDEIDASRTEKFANEKETLMNRANSSRSDVSRRYACYFILNRTETTENQTAQSCQQVLLPLDAPHKGPTFSLKVTLTKDTEQGENTIGNTERPFMTVRTVTNSSHPRLSTVVHLHPSPHNTVIPRKAV